jgi:hypothetical protein
LCLGKLVKPMGLSVGSYVIFSMPPFSFGGAGEPACARHGVLTLKPSLLYLSSVSFCFELPTELK